MLKYNANKGIPQNGLAKFHCSSLARWSFFNFFFCWEEKKTKQITIQYNLKCTSMTWWIVKCNIHGYYHMTFKCKIMHVTVRSQSQPTLGFSSSALPSFSSSSSSARAAATSGSRGIPYSTFALLACVRKVKDEAQGTKSNLDSNLLGRTQDFLENIAFLVHSKVETPEEDLVGWNVVYWFGLQPSAMISISDY